MVSILNDDCIYEILEWLSLDDLFRCSRTCKRLQSLCENHFLRKYPIQANEEVRIRIEFDGKLRVFPIKKYVNYFYNFIKNLHISVWNFQHNKEMINSLVVNFINSKCDRNLRRISLRGNIELVPLCKEIESFLRRVKVVEFSRRYESSQDEAIFLRYCPEVTKLYLNHPLHMQNVEAILLQKYHQLTHFTYVNYHVMNLNAKKLKSFFLTNKKIQYVAWECINYNGAELDNDCAMKCIQTLDYALNLQHLFLSIGPPLTKRIDGIFNHLNELCKRDNFKLLELQFDDVVGAIALNVQANRMSKWTQLTRIHLRCMRLSHMIPALRLLGYLKSLVLHYLWHEYFWIWLPEDGDRLEGSSQHIGLPQVDEVQIDSIEDDETIHNCVMQVFRHWKNLKRIFVPKSSKCNIKFDIDELNRARKKLEQACELTIFTNHKGNATNVDYDLVKLKFVEFKSDSFKRFFMPSGQ